MLRRSLLRDAPPLFFFTLSVTASLAGGCAPAAPAESPRPPAGPVAPLPPLEWSWQKLDTVPYKGKQDDIFFTDRNTGFYGNGAGLLYGTDDGGEHWRLRTSKPGTYIRALGFVDGLHGFLGNIGTDYFPGVIDTTPLYQTADGGDTWTAVTTITGDPVKGICAIDVLGVPFINAGYRDTRTILHAAGRVGGPAVLVTSKDGGKSWVSKDVRAYAGSIQDVHFIDAKTGFLCAGSDSEIERSHARILKTVDGGETWTTKYESSRPFETTWKCSFPSAKVGYATVQNYDERKEVTQRYVAKTTDGGETWVELPLVNDQKVQEFGVGFIDEQTGWVGARPGGFQTTDGGKTWSPSQMGNATNKIRFVRGADGQLVSGYAIGVDVYKLVVPAGAATAR